VGIPVSEACPRVEPGGRVIGPGLYVSNQICQRFRPACLQRASLGTKPTGIVCLLTRSEIFREFRQKVR
jgi:hypothetical protein